MDTTKARRHAEVSNSMLAQKASQAGFEVRTTASWHTNVAILSLCDALDEAFRVKPEEPGVFSHSHDYLTIHTREEGATYQSVPEYEKHTSPYRHQLRVQDIDGNTGALLGISARELAKDVD